MKLNNWLCDGAVNVSTSLSEMNISSNIGSKVLSYTTHAQVIDILNRIHSMLFPGLYESAPPNQSTLNTVFQNRLKHIAIELCEIINSVLDYTDNV